MHVPPGRFALIGDDLVRHRDTRPAIQDSRQPVLYDMQPKGTDTVPTMLTPGEFVVNREDTAKNLSLLQAINSGRQYAPASAPMRQAPPAQQQGTGGGVSFGNVTITEQSDPVATFHEFSRRAGQLAT